MIFPQKFVKRIKDHVNELRKEDAQLHKEALEGVLSVDKDLLSKIEEEDRNIFGLITELYHYGYLTDEDKRHVISLLERLHSLIKEAVSEGKAGEQEHELRYLVSGIEEFLEHEKGYLDYKPGAERKEYVKLSALLKSKDHVLVVNKAKLEYKGGRIFYEGKEVQGVKVRKDLIGYSVEITGEHYSSEGGIRDLYQKKALSPSTENVFAIGADPYCYLLESGRLLNQPENKIRKIVGARHADSSITVKVIVPVHNVWIRVKKGSPAKFAIESKGVPINAPKKQKGYKVNVRGRLQYWAA